MCGRSGRMRSCWRSRRSSKYFRLVVPRFASLTSCFACRSEHYRDGNASIESYHHHPLLFLLIPFRLFAMILLAPPLRKCYSQFFQASFNWRDSARRLSVSAYVVIRRCLIILYLTFTLAPMLLGLSPLTLIFSQWVGVQANQIDCKKINQPVLIYLNHLCHNEINLRKALYSVSSLGCVPSHERG